jgi:hypothetical protein
MSSLGACWDTLALTHFQLGHVDEAERYQLAAWDLTLDRSFILHLAQIASAKHDQALSSVYDEMATALRNSDRPVAGTEIRTIVEKNAALPAIRAMNRAWSLSVPRQGSATGSAQVYVLAGPDAKITDVAFISGDVAMRPQVDALRGLTLEVRLPSSTTARFLRRGTLQCTAGATACQFALVPAANAAAMRQ